MKHLVSIFILALCFSAFGHEAHHHGNHTQEAKKSDAKAELKVAYDEIESGYAKSVQPVFEMKCAACHSVNSESPWYSQVPGVGRIVESDRSEAKEHLEISKGFPFGGHGEPIEDLDAIAETVTKKTMPPRLYSFMHPSSKLTDAEKKIVLAWVEASKARLTALGNTEIKK